MSDTLSFILTNQGLQALINAEADGTQEIRLSHVGFGDSQYTPTASMTSLKHEITRVSTVSGANVGDHIIHITAQDDSDKSYNIYEAGIYATIAGEAEPILFAIYSNVNADPIIQKSSLSRAYIAFDLLISSDAIDQITFGDTNFLNPPATTETAGVAKLATQEEVQLGTNGTKIVTAATLKAALSSAQSVLFKSLCTALKANSSVMLPIAAANILGGVKIDGKKGLNVDKDGLVSVDFSSMPEEQLEGVVLAMVQTGGGISVDKEGKLYVDFESMPTDKFEAMLKSIKVPIWLTKNTNFYVNGTTGSDTLDEGRGLSADKPFKTIQACVNYVCDNYNLSRYNVNIHIADGTYEGGIILPNFTSSTGAIYIRPINVGSVTLISTNEGLITVKGGTWGLIDLDLEVTVSPSGSAQLNGIFALQALNNSTVYINGIYLTFNMQGDYSNDGRYCRCYSAESGAQFSFAESANRGFTINSNINESANLIAIFGKTGGGYITHTSYNISAETSLLCTVTGRFRTFISLEDGSTFSRITSRTYDFQFAADSVTGKRYEVKSGSWCNTGGMGEEFFPGDTVGSVEASTYSWYK